MYQKDDRPHFLSKPLVLRILRPLFGLDQGDLLEDV